jgi:hypothetical protein
MAMAMLLYHIRTKSDGAKLSKSTAPSNNVDTKKH